MKQITQLINYNVIPIQATIIQRRLRKAMHTRNDLYQKLLHVWYLAENNFYKDLVTNEALTSVSDTGIEALQKISIIPNPIKLVEITKKIKELTNLYSMRMRNYKSRKLIMGDSLLSLSWYSATALNTDSEKPVSPNILKEITIETISVLIQNVMRERVSLRKSHRFQN